MSYVTTAQIEIAAGGPDAFVALADWDGDQLVDDAVIARAKTSADGFIDAYLRLRMSQAELDALRAAPTDTIIEIASDEAVFAIRKWRNMVSGDELKLRDQRIAALKSMNLGLLRPSDKPSAQRAVFFENDHATSRKGTRGMW